MKDIKKYLKHLPNCNIMQDWSEAEMALADTPESLKDESWQLAYNEMREKMKTCTCGLETIVSKLREEPEEKETVNYYEVRELTDEEWLAMPKEEILQLYKNCYKLLIDHLKESSSLHPQPGRGAEDILYKHEKLNYLLMDKHLVSPNYKKMIIYPAMEEYRTQSEGKDMYPKGDSQTAEYRPMFLEGFRIDLYEDKSLLRRRGVANLFCHPDDLEVLKKTIKSE